MYRGVATLTACRKGDACQQMLEFEGYRTGRLCLACHDGDTRLFRRHQVVSFRGVEALTVNVPSVQVAEDTASPSVSTDG